MSEADGGWRISFSLYHPPNETRFEGGGPVKGQRALFIESQHMWQFVKGSDGLWFNGRLFCS